MDSPTDRDKRLRKFLCWQGSDPERPGLTPHQAVQLTKTARVTAGQEKVRDEVAKMLAKLVGRS